MTKYSSVVGNVKDDDFIAALWKLSFENLYSQHTNEGMLSDTCKFMHLTVVAIKLLLLLLMMCPRQ